MAKVLSDFKKTKACTHNNEFKLGTKKGRFFDEAIIVKDFCKDCITGEWSPTTLQELKDEIAMSYSDENIDSIEETQNAFVNKLAKCIWRYGKSEYRHNAMVPEAITLDLSDFVVTHFVDDDDIHVKFDVIVREPGKLEGIIYKPKAPKIGTTGRSYQNVNNTIELHLMRLALRKYADTFLTDGEQIEIYASYYYMSKTGDKTDVPFELEDYFDSKTPIRSQVETYTKGAISLPLGTNGLTPDTEEYIDEDGDTRTRPVDVTLDQKLQILLDKYAAGFEKCDLNEEKDCKGCQNYCVCYYQPAPIRFEEEKQIKVRKSHQLTDEQQKIVDFRHGVAICNAVPGSGKTETAIKQRTVSIVSEEADAIIAAIESGSMNYNFDEPVEPKFLTMDSRR